MNAVIPSGKAIDFEFSAADSNASAYAAMKIYDLSSGTATLITTVGMVHIFNGTYWGTYTFTVAQAGRSFLIQKSIYTDATYATLNPLYSPGSEVVGPVDGFDQDFSRAV